MTQKPGTKPIQPSSRGPSATAQGGPKPGTATPTGPRPRTPAASFRLTGPERLQAEANLKQGKHSPTASAAMRKALDGKILSPAEIKAIENDRDFNPQLSSVGSKASLSSVLDDQAEKRAALASKPGNGGGGTGGKVPALIVALAGLAGANGGGGGGGGGATDPGVSGPAFVDPPVGPSVAPPVVGSTIQPLYTEPPVADDPPATTRSSGPETGMRIVEVLEGSAAQKADLRVGDIVYEVGGQRVRNWDEYKAAMAAVSGSVEMVFFNSETKQLEKLEVNPQNGLLGAALEEGVLPG